MSKYVTLYDGATQCRDELEGMVNILGACVSGYERGSKIDKNGVYYISNCLSRTLKALDDAIQESEQEEK